MIDAMMKIASPASIAVRRYLNGLFESAHASQIAKVAIRTVEIERLRVESERSNCCVTVCRYGFGLIREVSFGARVV